MRLFKGLCLMRLFATLTILPTVLRDVSQYIKNPTPLISSAFAYIALSEGSAALGYLEVVGSSRLGQIR